jgi:hypothetical protein
MLFVRRCLIWTDARCYVRFRADPHGDDQYQNILCILQEGICALHLIAATNGLGLYRGHFILISMFHVLSVP